MKKQPWELDEDEDQADMDPAAEPAKPMDPKVRQYMLDKYFAQGGPADRSGIKDAQDKSNMLNAAGVGAQALSLATAGDSRPQVFKKGWNETGRPEQTNPYERHVDTSSLKQAGKVLEDRAGEEQQAKEKNFWAGNKLEGQARSEGMEDERMEQQRKEWARGDDRNDPNSPASVGFRNLVAKVAPSLAGSIDGMSLEDASKVVPGMVNAYEAHQARIQSASLAKTDKRNDLVDKSVVKASEKLAPMQELNNSIKSVEDQLGFNLDSYSPTKDKVNGKSVDLPGVSVPGIGRVSGYSSDARALQSSVAAVFNKELKDRSGAAITNNEMERLKLEFGAGKYNNESEMLSALKRYKGLAITEMQNREAGFSAPIIDEYKRRGGQTSGDFKQNEVKKTSSESTGNKPSWAK